METEPTSKQEEISKSDLDLTEEELSRIFFGSESKIPSNPIPAPKTKKHMGRPKKLQRQNIPVEVLANPEKILNEPKEEKRPQGRPLKWTPEKIEQLKEENATLALQRRKERFDKIRLSKLSIQEPVTGVGIERLVNTAIKSKEEIEKHISEKRTILKDILKDKRSTTFPFLRRSIPECNHIYKLHHFDTCGKVVVACNSCSLRDEMTMDEWNSYLKKHRKQI